MGGGGTVWKVAKCGVFSGLYFPVFGLNTEIYEVNLRIQSEYRKIRTRKNTIFGHFSRSVSRSLFSKNASMRQMFDRILKTPLIFGSISFAQKIYFSFPFLQILLTRNIKIWILFLWKAKKPMMVIIILKTVSYTLKW